MLGEATAVIEISSERVGAASASWNAVSPLAG
jgi:hypothetical protein